MRDIEDKGAFWIEEVRSRDRYSEISYSKPDPLLVARRLKMSI